MRIGKITILAFLAFSVLLVVCGGCNVVGFLVSPSAHERKVKAEFRLTERQKGRILVLVDRSRSGSVPVGFASQLLDTVRQRLVKKARIKEKYLVVIDGTSPENANASRLIKSSPAEVARDAGVETVLYVEIQDCKIVGMVEKDYYEGSVTCRAALLDSSGGRILWPDDGGGRLIRVRVELETRGRQVVLNRLAGSASHCIVRNFYDCPRTSYRTADEVAEFDFGN